MIPDLRSIGKHFSLRGLFLDGGPYGNGHINDTYLSRWKTGGKIVCWIQQRINHDIFKDPPKLMENIVRVTAHLHTKLAAEEGRNQEREALTVIPTAAGKPYWRDEHGNYWRTYIFIDKATSYDLCTGPGQAFEAASAFGRFQQLLADLPGERLHDTIPYFHHTPTRFAALQQAIKNDTVNRCARAREEIKFALDREPMTSVITELMAEGEIPQRTTHNDTKLNNVMIDNETGKGVCVIDLDTVMSGSVLYDFGDLVRTCTITCMEDEQDLRKVRIDLKRFDALVRGYVRHAAAFLTRSECEHLAFAGRLITFTIGIRFLTDYLNGDVYFKTHRPEHNIERASVQFRMIRHMEEQSDKMEKLVSKYCG